MRELMKLRDRLLGEYEYAVEQMDTYGEADGLLVAIKMVEEQIDHLLKEKGL